jgi:ATP-binding protein involved in chromosome partitioning
MQTLDLDGFITVTTPQELATLDARRSINMIRKMNLKVIGVVENMSGEIFGRGAGRELADDLDIPFFGAIELSADFRENNKPAVLMSDTVANEFHAIAENLRAASTKSD